MNWWKIIIELIKKWFDKDEEETSPDGELPFDWDKLKVLSSGTANPGEWTIKAKLNSVSIGNTISYSDIDGGIPQWPLGISGHNHCIGFVYQPEELKESRKGYYCTGEWGNPNQFVNDGKKPFMSKRGSKTFFSGEMENFAPNGQDIWVVITTINWLNERSSVNERLTPVKATLTK